MRKVLFFTVLCVLLGACERINREESGARYKIAWDVKEVSSADTKSLIGNYDGLQAACTPVADGGLGKSIGFFAELEKDGRTEIDIFGTKETQLIYKSKPGSPYIWNYTRRNEAGDPKEDLEWVDGATYHIRAYFPQSLNTLIEPSTTARCFVMNYNTHHTQEDLLVAFNRVYTKDPISGEPSICIAAGPSGEEIESEITLDHSGSDAKYGYGQSFDLGRPIPLYFQHALSAVRVRFKFDFDTSNEDTREFYVEDELLSCYFSNSDGTNGLHTTGAMVFGNEHLEKPEHTILEEYWKSLTWKSKQSSMAGVHYYRWGMSDEDIAAGEKKGTIISRKSVYNGGSERIVSDRMAVAYTNFRTQDVVSGGNASTDVQVAEGPLAMTLKSEAPYFNENDGWLLIIPQKAVSGLRFNFTTRRMGLVSAQVPPITMTGANGVISTLEAAVSEQNYYLPGYRYTYTLTISETDIKMSLSMSGWNEIYASEDIVF